MKKESRFIPLGVKKRVKKIKGLWMLLIGLCFLGSQTAVAQETGKRVTLDLQEVTMKAFVGELQRQTGYAFFYKEDVAALVEPVTVSVANADLSAVLEEVLGQKGCTFTFEGETVVIRKRVESQGQVEERKVIGVVKDEHGQPLPGVAVVLKGTTVGTATDMDGNYALSLPKGNYTLVFSMLGMKAREEQVGDRTEINVVMQEEAAEMDEVVVTGIFTKPKESYTGAVTTITSKDLQRVGNRNILNYREIKEGKGVVISEFPPNTAPVAYNFPIRNRIITGLSYGTIVAEAAIKSGAMISANLTLEQNRESMCIPGLISNPNCEGIYHLIKNGASIVTSACDVFEVLNWDFVQNSEEQDETKQDFFDNTEDKKGEGENND